MKRKQAPVLPCPFCGKDPELIEDQYETRLYMVGCMNIECLIRPETVYCEKMSKAIGYWNKRP
jgi:hypothetical protein